MAGLLNEKSIEPQVKIPESLSFFFFCYDHCLTLGKPHPTPSSALRGLSFRLSKSIHTLSVIIWTSTFLALFRSLPPRGVCAAGEGPCVSPLPAFAHSLQLLPCRPLLIPSSLLGCFPSPLHHPSAVSSVASERCLHQCSFGKSVITAWFHS